jgi:hypothetical protein
LAKKPEDHLPKKAPKKTGKKGIGPLDDEATKLTALKPEPSSDRGKRQKELPGMENKHLEDLEETATDYAEVRDKRMALTRRETDLKDVLLTLMKRHEKTVYRVEEMEIRVVAKDETVKVKILSDED